MSDTQRKIYLSKIHQNNKRISLSSNTENSGVSSPKQTNKINQGINHLLFRCRPLTKFQ